MTDDRALPPETPQTPVSDGLATTPNESVSQPSPEAASGEPAQPVSETASEAVTAEPQSEPEPPEPEPAPRTQGAATAAASSVSPTNTPERNRELLVKARAVLKSQRQAKLEKIMTLFEKKDRITNDEVEKLLHCSDATALRYLNELVKQGKIQRVGKTGSGVEYTKI